MSETRTSPRSATACPAAVVDLAGPPGASVIDAASRLPARSGEAAPAASSDTPHATGADQPALSPAPVARSLSAVSATDEVARVRMAAMAETPPAVLEMLARDPILTVRAAVAMNPAAPGRAEALLAGDPDERIRIMLGRKLALLMPTLAGPEREALQASALETLNRLVADEAVRVRAAIAAVLREMADVPHALIVRLANDQAVSVHEPVIRLSPLLSAGDLLGLLSAPQSPSTATAIARRRDLDAAVSDAIAESTDDGAICALLENGSAAIREATLDGLIARAAGRETWHEPLVRRPCLTAKAAHALSGIVATHLLGILADRADLHPTVTRALKGRLDERLDGAASQRRQPETLDEAMAEARVLYEEGQLTEDKLLRTVGEGRSALAQAMLAVAADVSGATVERAINLRNAKALVSLVWRAGFSMRCATTLQSLLGRIPPGSALRATGSAGFPLSIDEMKYQIELIGRKKR